MGSSASKEALAFERFISGEYSFEQYAKHMNRVHVMALDLVQSIKDDLCHVLPDKSIKSHHIHLFESLSKEKRKELAHQSMFSLLWSSPEFVFPLGFDEIRFTNVDTLDEDRDALLIEDAFKKGVRHSLLEELGCAKCASRIASFAFPRPQFRTLSGSWHTYASVINTIVPKDVKVAGTPGLDDWFSATGANWLTRLKKAKDVSPHNTFCLPAMNFPTRILEDTLLHESSRKIIMELFLQKRRLREIHWRTLEEIVAELLLDMGLDVVLTDRSWDGGRDVIGRGELIPGEPAVLAVEVKQMPIVPVAELRKALWANRHYPALLFASSGRFSAGVFREKSTNESNMRLYLKDGFALQQWIDLYAARHDWRDIRKRG